MPADELAKLLLRIEARTGRLRREFTVVEGATRQTGERIARAFARASRSLGDLACKL